jgi:hypothetical protein
MMNFRYFRVFLKAILLISHPDFNQSTQSTQFIIYFFNHIRQRDVPYGQAVRDLRAVTVLSVKMDTRIGEVWHDHSQSFLQTNLLRAASTQHFVFKLCWKLKKSISILFSVKQKNDLISINRFQNNNTK